MTILAGLLIAMAGTAAMAMLLAPIDPGQCMVCECEGPLFGPDQPPGQR